MHEVLVNRLGGLSLPRKSVARLNDRPDMTLNVYRGRKTTMQQQQQPRNRGLSVFYKIKLPSCLILIQGTVLMNYISVFAPGFISVKLFDLGHLQALYPNRVTRLKKKEMRNQLDNF